MMNLPALRTRPRWHRGGVAAVAMAACALLAGCAVPELQKPGTSLDDIEKAMGRPTLVVPLEGGGTRLLYSRQPAGQQVYHMDFDAQRRLLRVEQALTLERFHTLRNGEDDKNTVLREFGPPALFEKVASFHGDIWTYRILDNGSWRQAHVHIDPAGVVRRVMFTDELLHDEVWR